MKRTVLVLIPLPDALLARLKIAYDVIICRPQGGCGDAGALKSIEAVITNGTTGLGADRIQALPRVSLICCYGAGYEGVDLQAARRRGITVSNAPGLNHQTVADHALALTLALARDLMRRDAAVRHGRWQEARWPSPGMHGSIVGIVGMGRIGRLIAERAAGFGSRVRYHSRRPKPELPWRFDHDLVRMAERADFLIAACPGGDETRHLIGSSVLAALGPAGFLINVARGSVVDTEALLDALAHGSIAGAGLDVIEGEPAISPRFLAMTNVLLTPHVAGRSPQSVRAQSDALLVTLERHFAGEPVPSPVVL